MIYTTDELKEILAKHQTWLFGDESGSRANLIGADLSGADLIGANLIGANLSRANLIGANLIDADLIDADLSGADLSGADLIGANLIGANLSRANLIGANLSRADLILIGQDIRGYLFWSYKNENDVLVIRAGCRIFVGMAAAYAHWKNRHTRDSILHEDILSLLDRAERMAKVRGWKTEVE